MVYELRTSEGMANVRKPYSLIFFRGQIFM